MSSLKTSAYVDQLSKDSFVAKLTFKHGQNTREFFKTGKTKGEAMMKIMALPEYKAKPAPFTL